MTITLPDELGSRVQQAVDSGRFASVADAMAEAARLLLHELERTRRLESLDVEADHGPDLFLGSLRDAAPELDEIVADAYRKRSEETWRVLDLE